MSAKTAAVALVGAGPGAADLLTLRAVRAIAGADVLIVDKILGEDFLDRLDLDLAGREVVWLGHAGPVRDRQDAINHLMVARARAGLRVARIKNGDPLVFGRGAEEAEHLDRHDVRWEYLPGLSSTISVLTNAGYAITDRGGGRDFAIASARCAGGGINPNLPRAETLIVLMGFHVLGGIVGRLLAEGRDPSTPALIVERGTMAYERRLEAPLGAIAVRAEEAGIGTPAILVVGGAAARHRRSAQRPLVLFTGARPDDWRDLGDLLHWPALAEDGAPAPELGIPLPDHDATAFLDPASVDAWHAAYGEPGFAADLLAAGDAAARIAELLGGDRAVNRLDPRNGLGGSRIPTR